MRVVAFMAAEWAELQGETVSARGFPQIGFAQKRYLWPSVPVVLIVSARAGQESYPVFFVSAQTPDGDRCGGIEWVAHWPDDPVSPFKYVASVHHLKFYVASPGVYTLGVYTDPDATTALAEIPYEVTLARP
ncbi:hypothetical protein [Mycolicibacterium pulveris]|uniref:hypothetical protein n=1 Tax=Mycolicibacterium pulveris TaxID=36813 RepID=UPI003CEFC659